MISVSDIYLFIIPERLLVYGLVLGFIQLYVNESLLSISNANNYLQSNILACIYSLIIMIFIKYLSEKLTNKKCLGIGDAKLICMGAAWLGLKGISITLIISFLTAGIHGLIKRIISDSENFQPFPFAPFISLSIFFVWILGEDWFIDSWFGLWGL